MEKLCGCHNESIIRERDTQGAKGSISPRRGEVEERFRDELTLEMNLER